MTKRIFVLQKKVFKICILALCIQLSSARINAQSHLCITNRFAQNNVFEPSVIKKDSNLVYAVARSFSGLHDSLKLDVYFPDTLQDPLKKRPLIVFVHGGAFYGGSRFDMNYHCMEMARRGFVTATITYRLGWNCPTMPLYCTDQCFASGFQLAQYRATQDARAALRYLVHLASRWSIDTSFIAIGGISAGGITSLETAFWTQTEADSYVPQAKEQLGLLDTSGNSFPADYTIKAVINSCGAINDTGVMNERIPVISFHDAGDCVVPFQRGRVLGCGDCLTYPLHDGPYRIYKKQQLMQVCSQVHWIPFNGVPWPFQDHHCVYSQDILIQRSACFLKGLMCRSCSSSDNNNFNGSIPSCSELGNPTSVQPMNKGMIQDLRIYPAAAKDEWQLQFRVNQSGQVQFSVYDVSGKLVVQKPAKRLGVGWHNATVRIAGQSSGIYFLNVRTSNGNLVQKLYIP